MKIFGGSTSNKLAQKVAEKLKIKLSSLEIHVFPDEEKRVRCVEKVLEEDCVIVQSTSINADKNYMELFLIVDALKRNGAKTVTAIIPYLGYQRQDHIFREGEGVSIEVIIKLLESVGIDKIITFDLHSVRIPELFRVPVIHLSALSLFADKIKQNQWSKTDTSLISPDMGGIRRIKILSQVLNGMPYAIIEKNRNLKSGAISIDDIQGATKKRAVIVDDMISTGTTIIRAAELLSKKGVEEIFVFATHAVFSDNATQMLQGSVVQKVCVTNTIDVASEKYFPKIEVLSVAGMIAEEL
ncbi:MAG: ribose-phosphate pyrophosphokinase [Patescibacteria group bacterium]